MGRGIGSLSGIVGYDDCKYWKMSITATTMPTWTHKERCILIEIFFFMKEKVFSNTLNIIPSMSITWNTMVKNLHGPSFWFVW